MSLVSWRDLRAEPFRLFFPLGALFGCWGVGHWLAYAAGWMPDYSGFQHASLQVGLYMNCFILGFLLTALPRFSSTPAASTGELLAALGLLGVQAAGLWARRWMVAEGAFAGLLILLASFAGRRLARRRASSAAPPTEFVWIPIALLLGLAGTVLLMGGQALGWPSWALAVGRPMAQQGFVLGIVVGVGGFMGPRLMGRGALPTRPDGVARARVPALRRRRVMLHLAAGAVFGGSFLLEGAGHMARAYLLRAAVVTAELGWTTQFVRPPAVRDRYVMLLWLSFWMVVLGLWGAALLPRYRVAALHVVFLGGFSLMTFAVATMVVLSHTGEGQRLRQPLWVLRVVAVAIAGALIGRLIADAQPESFFHWLAAASVCWLIAGASWLAFVLPRVARPIDPGAFERVHEAAKRRVLHDERPPAC